MQTTFEAIRALKTRFVVIKNSSEEFTLRIVSPGVVYEM